MVILDAECRSLKRTAIVMNNVVGLSVSTNTIERVALEVGTDLEAAQASGWQDVLTGEVPIPSLAIVEFDGGRIRTRKTGCGPGVHLENKGSNESKNAIFVSADSETSDNDPQPQRLACFLNRDHVAKLTEHAKLKENPDQSDVQPNETETQPDDAAATGKDNHRPKRIIPTVIASMKNLTELGHQMQTRSDSPPLR